MTSEAAKGAGGGPSPATTMITPAEPADQATPTRVRAKPVTPRPSRVYAVELPSFEGPLDLLLHLVRRHELDILDIPIAFVTEKYLEYLSIMRALDIEILGDYLVMAATLAYLKSRELVPQQTSEEEGGDEDDEDGEDPREALIRRLIEYERFRAAGRELNEMPVIGRDVFARGGNIDLPPLDPGMAPVTLFRLTEAYARVLQRAQINKSHVVQLERVTVRQRMEQLSLLLEERESVDFESLFLEQEWGSVEELRQMLVVTLMSVLELVKLGIIGVRQAHDTESIHLQRRASYAEAMKALTSYSEDDSFGEGGGVAGGGKPVTPAAALGVAPQGGSSAGAAELGVSATESASTVLAESHCASVRDAEELVEEPGASEPGERGPFAEPGVAPPGEPEAELDLVAELGERESGEPDPAPFAEPGAPEAGVEEQVTARGVTEPAPRVQVAERVTEASVTGQETPRGATEPGDSAQGTERGATEPSMRATGKAGRDAFSEDALGAMLASVRRLEGVGEGSDAAGDAALAPDTPGSMDPEVPENALGTQQLHGQPASGRAAPEEARGEEPERGRSTHRPGLGLSTPPVPGQESPQEKAEDSSGGDEPPFIDAMDDSGESHE